MIEEMPSSGIRRFIEILEEVERSGRSGKAFSGEMEGPFGSQAEYDLVIWSGFERSKRRASKGQYGLAPGD